MQLLNDESEAREVVCSYFRHSRHFESFRASSSAIQAVCSRVPDVFVPLVGVLDLEENIFEMEGDRLIDHVDCAIGTRAAVFEVRR